MEKQNICIGLLAHVDAGKTTLSEALLYHSGARRTLGRVDHRDAFLDTHDLERARGITIFSKQALLETGKLSITLLDTPGHPDFVSEAERVMPVLDCAVLLISAAAGVQPHTLTLWRLLEHYNVPVFLFINKMDLPDTAREQVLAQLQQKLSSCCIDLQQDRSNLEETVALCDEALLEQYLAGAAVTDDHIRQLIARRKLFPCCFGSGLKLQGTDSLLQALNRYAPVGEYGESFAAKVFKITRDPQGNRLTWLKLTGGKLQVRQSLSYRAATGEQLEEKAVQLRLYSGDKFTPVESVHPGQICAVAGLTKTRAGQVFGAEGAEKDAVSEAVMTYQLQLPAGCDPVVALQKLRQLEEEDPQLHILWDEQLGQIHIQIMGAVQLQVLRSVIAQRFCLDISFGSGKVAYKETIANTVEGVGHFEPLRHYAEVHILLEPLPRGSGLVFDTVCSADVLDMSYQKLILSHLAEKVHKGVLVGAPITDMKLTLLVGRAHIKHTEGGDFRQATYRAVRQGLMQAQSVLLEPWYHFTLAVPTPMIGRAITDIRAMCGEFSAPESQGDFSALTGRVPVAALGNYADQVAAYTQGQGQLFVSLQGYAPCHNSQQVIAETGYDPEADLENTPDSVFCAHGAGFPVKWDKVRDYMHLESGLKKSPQETPSLITRNLRLDDKELEAIMLREFGPVKRPQYTSPERQPADEKLTIHPPRDTALIVDGYNIIFAWDTLSSLAQTDLASARRQLCDILSSYAGFRGCYLVVVFDGYKVKGNLGEKQQFNHIQVVYTKENETADAYIEALAARIGRNYAVKVATSDALVQLSSLRSGVLRMSARELWEEITRAREQMQAHFNK